MKIKDLSELELHDEIILDIEMKSIKDYFDNICIRIEHCKKTILIKCSDCFSANYPAPFLRAYGNIHRFSGEL